MAALAPIVDTIGVVSGVLGIVGFIQGNIPKEPVRGATVRIKAGKPGKHNGGMVSEPPRKATIWYVNMIQEGDVAATYAWDVDNYYLGKSGGSFIQIGDIADLTIDSFSGGTRAEYVGVAATKNAICVA